MRKKGQRAMHEDKLTNATNVSPKKKIIDMCHVLK